MKKNNFWNKKNVLVTGGSGFVGKNVIKRLIKDKIRFYAPTRSELKLDNFL